MTIVAISPHLDDAVLSVGGSIARWVAAGERVMISTLYTVGPPLEDVSPDMRKWADYESRRAEDATAIASLGAEHRWLGLVERPFRRPFLDGLSYLATPPTRGGFTGLAEATAALATLDELAPSKILVPLGIGNHIDHVATLIAATEWALARGWRDRVWFYEDFYALSRAIRSRHPITKRDPWPRRRAPLVRARRLGGILRAIAAARRGPDVTTYLAPALRDASWTLVRSPIAEAAKLAAIARYPSQATAFGGMPGIARALHAYHGRFGGCEPLWRAQVA